MYKKQRISPEITGDIYAGIQMIYAVEIVRDWHGVRGEDYENDVDEVTGLPNASHVFLLFVIIAD